MNKTKNNNGFTLIELIIAIAILAFLMAAVSSFMGTGVLSFKKAKADITVHTSAQDVYDCLTDGIMSANDLIIYGYVASGTMTGTTAGSDLDFSDSGEAAATSLDGPYYFVRDEEQKGYLTSGSYTETNSDGTTGETTYYTLNNEYDGSSDVYTYTELAEKDPDAKIYVRKIIIERAKTIDMDTLTASQTSPAKTTTAGNYYYNYFEPAASGTMSYLIAEQQEQATVTTTETASGTTEELISQSGNTVTSANGEVYIKNDTERIIISFNEECMYYETEYAFQTTLNDSYKTANPSQAFKNTDYTNASYSSNMSPYLYSESLSYLTEVEGAGSDATATGCVATLDVDSGAVQFDLYFSDKNMTYTTLGMVNIRNSYVLKAKQ